jgi:adenine C2-methylase RlmN of 23S rRNA A2503 and tRNA A37
LRARLAAHPFGLPAGNRTVETVRMPEESRETICIAARGQLKRM